MLPIVSLLGIPAGGKGTLGPRLAEQFNFYYLSIGDMLRSIKKPCPTVRQLVEGEALPPHLLTALEGWMDEHVDVVIRSYRDLRAFVPLGIVLPVLREHIKEIEMNHDYKGILLDGFPRQLDHAKLAKQYFGPRFPRLTIVIECPAHIARSRYLQRGRHNDNLVHFEKRLDHFWMHMDPLLKELETSGLVRTVNDDSMTIQQAYLALLAKLFHNETWNNIVNMQSERTLTSHITEPPSLSKY
ncbi:P-loop containing nucleoside triphosphate hydrolase protein [Hypoxylon sp. FL1857]|nr:P-loop containing nucleoside triphosphate hydrolase protein [Hypoxylon sp. FL1857]